MNPSSDRRANSARKVASLSAGAGPCGKSDGCPSATSCRSADSCFRSAESARGAYQGFFDSNIQPDFVHINHVNEYPLVYLPYPVMLKQETAQKLILPF